MTTQSLSIFLNVVCQYSQIFVYMGKERVTPCVVSRRPSHGSGGRATLPRPVKSICDHLTPAAEVSVKVTFSVARWEREIWKVSIQRNL